MKSIYCTSQYIKVQAIAKDVMRQLVEYIRPGMTEDSIARQARCFFKEAGVEEFWYYDVAALVLVGDRSILSISGRDYVPSAQEYVSESDLVTIDLSPVVDGIWGDYARSVYIEDGAASFEPSSYGPSEMREGFNAEARLHDQLVSIATPQMTAHELWCCMNDEIISLGFENLDFKGNVGHSIERNMSDRQYIEQGNNVSLGDLNLFTFEPHIKKADSSKGFKHENIYRFSENKLKMI